MKKHFLRLLVVMLMLCFGVGVLVACGGDEEGDNGDNGEQPGGEEPGGEEPGGEEPGGTQTEALYNGVWTGGTATGVTYPATAPNDFTLTIQMAEEGDAHAGYFVAEIVTSKGTEDEYTAYISSAFDKEGDNYTYTYYDFSSASSPEDLVGKKYNVSVENDVLKVQMPKKDGTTADVTFATKTELPAAIAIPTGKLYAPENGDVTWDFDNKQVITSDITTPIAKFIPVGDYFIGWVSASMGDTQLEMGYTFYKQADKYYFAPPESDGMELTTTKPTPPSPTVKYTVTYDAGEAGDNATDMPADKFQYEQGETLTLPTQKPAWEGHTFTGWKASTDQKTYEAGSDYTFGTENVTFTAQWTDNGQTAADPIEGVWTGATEQNATYTATVKVVGTKAYAVFVASYNDQADTYVKVLDRQADGSYQLEDEDGNTYTGRVDGTSLIVTYPKKLFTSSAADDEILTLTFTTKESLSAGLGLTGTWYEIDSYTTDYTGKSFHFDEDEIKLTEAGDPIAATYTEVGAYTIVEYTTGSGISAMSYQGIITKEGSDYYYYTCEGGLVDAQSKNELTQEEPEGDVYTIAYNAGNITDDTEYHVGDTVNITSVKPTKWGYTFAGWYLGSYIEGESTLYGQEGGQQNTYVINEEDAIWDTITFKAKWTEIPAAQRIYTVSFMDTSKDQVQVPADIPNLAHNASVTIPEMTGTRNGHVFLGWALMNDTETLYNYGNATHGTYIVSNDDVDEDTGIITFYAVWDDTFPEEVDITGVWTTADGSSSVTIIVMEGVGGAVVKGSDGYTYFDLTAAASGYNGTGGATFVPNATGDQLTVTIDETPTTYTRQSADPGTIELEGKKFTGSVDYGDGPMAVTINFETEKITMGSEAVDQTFTYNPIGSYCVITVMGSNIIIYQEGGTYYAAGLGANSVQLAEPKAKFNVTFDLGAHAAEGAQAEAQNDVEDGSKITLPTVAAATGYKFEGWFDGDQKVTLDGENKYTVTKTVELTAHWTALEYTLTFDTNKPAEAGDAAITGEANNITVTLDAATTSLPELSLTGYLFNGWKLNNAGDAKTTFTLTTDLIEALEEGTTFSFTADWTKVEAGKVAITFEKGADDASIDGMPASTQVAAGEYTIPAQEPTRTGYTFKGWKVGEDATIYKTGTEHATYTVVAETPVIFTAQWDAKTYTVTLSAGDHGTYETEKTVTATFGQALTITENPTANTGYTFTGWKKGEADFESGTVWTFDEESVTLTAQYEAKTYTVKLSAGGHGSFDGGDKTLTATYDQAFTIEDEPTADTGYTFTGWKKGGEAFTSGSVWTFDEEGEITLTAQYDAKTYTVKLAAGEHGTYETEKTVQATYGQVLTIGEENNPTANAGYKFTGWKKGDDDFTSGTAWTFDAEGEITLTAQYEAITYTVNFYTEKGEEDVAYGTATVTGADAVGAEGLPEEEPSKKYYRFDGWFLADDETEVDAAYAPSAQSETTVKAYAKWTLVETLPVGNPNPTDSDPVVIGNDNNTSGEPGPDGNDSRGTGVQWIGKIEKGYHYTYSGTQTSDATNVAFSILTYIWSGLERHGFFRADRFIADNTWSNDVLANTWGTAENWVFTKNSTVNDFGTKFSNALNGTFSIDVDWTDEAVIMVYVRFTATDGAETGYGDSYYTIMASAGHTLKDEYSIGFACEKSQAKIKSITKDQTPITIDAAKPTLSDNQETPVIGSDALDLAFTRDNPAWYGKSFKQGEKIVLTGKLKAGTNDSGAHGFYIPIAYLMSGRYNFSLFRLDGWIGDVNSGHHSDWEGYTNTSSPALAGADTNYGGGAGNSDTEFLNAITAGDMDFTLTYAWTTAKTITITAKFQKGSVERTTVFTITAKGAKFAAKEYYIGLGGEHIHLQISSIVYPSEVVESDTAEYTFKYYQDKDAYEEELDTKTATLAKGAHLTAESIQASASKTNYTFAGWYIEEDGEEIKIDETFVPSDHDTADHTFTVYAKWTLNDTITVDSVTAGPGWNNINYVYPSMLKVGDVLTMSGKLTFSAENNWDGVFFAVSEDANLTTESQFVAPKYDRGFLGDCYSVCFIDPIVSSGDMWQVFPLIKKAEGGTFTAKVSYLTAHLVEVTYTFTGNVQLAGEAAATERTWSMTYQVVKADNTLSFGDISIGLAGENCSIETPTFTRTTHTHSFTNDNRCECGVYNPEATEEISVSTVGDASQTFTATAKNTPIFNTDTDGAWTDGGNGGTGCTTEIKATGNFAVLITFDKIRDLNYSDALFDLRIDRNYLTYDFVNDNFMESALDDNCTTQTATTGVKPVTGGTDGKWAGKVKCLAVRVGTTLHLQISHFANGQEVADWTRDYTLTGFSTEDVFVRIGGNTFWNDNFTAFVGTAQVAE